MSFYPKKINDRFHAPRNVGRLDDANALGTSATFVCGMFLRFSLRIDPPSREILDAKFQTNGCGYLIASADVLAEKIVGKRLNEIHGSDKDALRLEIEDALGEFPENRKHCLDLVLETLQNAFADFRLRRIEEFAGEKALICTCFGVSEDRIEEIIKQNSPETVEEIGDLCNAGTGCGSCQFLIAEMIDVYYMEH